MASLQSYFPKWLLDSKDHVSQTKEWSLFLGELHEAIQQQLTESHVQFFTDLSGPEKTLFMERAIRAIETGGVFRNLFSRVSVLLDQHLNEDVARALMEDRVTDTKTDLVVAAAEEGAVSLLRRWPEMRSKLHICLNQPLPKALRTLGWKLLLSNTKIRKHYADVMSKNPRRAVSTFDLEISQKCEHLLNSEPTLSHIKGSVGGFYAMKAVLSYHQSRLHSQSRLPDIDYMLMVPFVLVASDQLSRREPADGKIVAQLVEEYLSFMDSRPGYMVDSGSEIHNTRVHGFVEKLTEQIEAQEPELAKALAKNFLPAKVHRMLLYTFEEKIITTETAGHQVFVDGLKSLIRPVLRAMFVGYLNADTLLYIWDQYMIGLDTPGFADELLPVLVATFFVLLRDNLQECQSLGSVESVLRRQGVKLTVAQFQYQIKTTRYTDLYRLLEKDNKAAIPVLDPTQGRESPWRHWFNDVIPSYTRPQDRRRAREQREADRERLQRQQMEAENLNKEQEERDRRVAEEEKQRLAEKERERANQERGLLEQLLEQEKRSREEAALRYQEEIEKLRLEIGALRGQQKQQRPQTNQSLASSISRVLVPPPPPSLASRVTSRPRLAEDTPHSPATRAQDVSPVAVDVPTPPTITSPVGTPQEQTEDAILDFFRRIHHSVNKIGHGESRERAELDEDTRDGLRAHVRDVKRAEMEIFNRNLEENEFSRLSPSTQKEASDRMMELIQQYRRERAGPPRRGRRR